MNIINIRENISVHEFYIMIATLESKTAGIKEKLLIREIFRDRFCSISKIKPRVENDKIKLLV